MAFVPARRPSVRCNLRCRWFLALVQLLLLLDLRCLSGGQGLAEAKPAIRGEGQQGSGGKQAATKVSQGGKAKGAVPGFDQCNFCASCSVEPAAAAAREADAASGPEDLQPEVFPTWSTFRERAQMPNCTQCAGCNVELVPLHKAHNVTFMNKTQMHSPGLTCSWLFNAPSTKTASGAAVVKVSGIPYHKLGLDRAGIPQQEPWAQALQRQLALEAIIADCGFEPITTRVWVERVTAVVPELGFRIDWPALWQERAEGISLEIMSRLFHGDKVEGLLGIVRKLQGKQVVLAAIFDLLISSADRTLRNVMVTEAGQLLLIDNDDSLGAPHPFYALNSVFIPTTRAYELSRGAFVRDGLPPFSFFSMLLDYRCSGGEMGTRYPPKVTQCLKRMASLGPQGVQARYGLPTAKDATMLHARASDMINRGFEWTLKNGLPERPRDLQFPLLPPCCEIKWDDEVTRFRCAVDHPEWKKAAAGAGAGTKKGVH